MNNNKILHFLDLLAIFGISLISLIAITIQLITHELPCPLCLLQRVGLLAVALPYIMNLTIRRSRFHYLIAIIASFITMIPACRQIFLHIAPNTGNYGSPFFGLHLYTWVFILGLVSIFLNASLMSLCSNDDEGTLLTKTTKLIITFYVLIISFNVISTFLECGFTQCPSDPTHYEILYKLYFQRKV